MARDDRLPAEVTASIALSRYPVGPVAEAEIQRVGWAILRPPPGEPGLRGLAVQWEPGYLPPSWSSAPGEPQMMMHLDIAVDNLDAGVAWALQSGATLPDYQPQEHVRVLLDPAGHPFCLFRSSPA
jgi:hypothetical protein